MAMQECLEADLIKREHLIAALSSVKAQTTADLVKYYENYADGVKR